MRNPHPNHSFSILLSLILLIVCGGLFSTAAPTAAHSNSGGPLRLRLKVQKTTLRSDQSISIWADFLDGDYNQVENDATRVVEFSVAGTRGASGSITPPQVKVKPGERSAFASFNPEQAGRVLIKAQSEGLDSDETFVLVTRPAASLLSQVFGMFETVAYAQEGRPKIEILPYQLLKTSIGSQVKFQVSFSGTLPADSTIKISTDPAATIKYHGEVFERVTEIPVKDITSNKDGGMSDSMYITSHSVGEVEVNALVHPRGPRTSATATFSPRSPSRIVFDDTSIEIPSTQTAIPISIQLADENNHPIQSDGTRTITFRRANQADPVEFEQQSVVFTPNQKSAGTMVNLNGSPRENEVMLFAVSEGDNSVKPGHTTIFIRRPIGVMLYSLVLAALAGGLVGGVVRHIPRDYKLKQVLPKWTGECWDLGLVGRVASSVVCGLFLYLTMKLGLARVLGSTVLPAGIDLGTKLVAFFFGGIGGFAGTLVFDRLVSWCLPNPQSVKTPPVGAGANQPAGT